MTRFVVAGLLMAATLASLAAPHAQAAWCSFDTQRVEEAGVGFDCRFPDGLPACMGHTPGFDVPVPYVDCGGAVVPPQMAALCVVHVGAVPDDQVACTTENYVPGTKCGAVFDGADPLATTASC